MRIAPFKTLPVALIFCGRKVSSVEKLNFQMESFNQLLNNDYVQYQHCDPFRFARWTARESFEYMQSRPWHQVLDFYSSVVNDSLSLSTLFGFKACHVHDEAEISECLDETKLEMISPKERSGRWARVTFKVILSYHGDSFDGWQKQPGLNTVQGLVERSLGIFVDENKVQQLKDKSLPIEGRAQVAGRTDKGVTAIGQVCSFYTWRKDVKTQDIEGAINSAAPGKLKVHSVSKVSRAFHPNFSANWRRYLYIFPFNDGEDEEQITQSGENAGNHRSDIHKEQKHEYGEYSHEIAESFPSDCQEEQENGKKPQTFSVNRVNQLLQQLEGKLLSYKMFARDTKASRNIGPPTECFVYHARATVARLPCLDCIEGRRVMCIELVANRFLRKMVRVLVATAIREAAAGAEEASLVKLMDATCRRATAPPAPPYGLSLVDVGYGEFNANNCFIPKE